MSVNYATNTAGYLIERAVEEASQHLRNNQSWKACDALEGISRHMVKDPQRRNLFEAFRHLVDNFNRGSNNNALFVAAHMQRLGVISRTLTDTSNKVTLESTVQTDAACDDQPLAIVFRYADHKIMFVRED